MVLMLLLLEQGVLLIYREWSHHLHLFQLWESVKSSNSIDGWDSVLSILQMPNGVPVVSSVALNGAKNAGILAATILGATDQSVRRRVDHKHRLANPV